MRSAPRVEDKDLLRFLVARKWQVGAAAEQFEAREKTRRDMAVGQHQWYHFGVDAPPILVYVCGDWDVHCGYGVLTHSRMGAYMPRKAAQAMQKWREANDVDRYRRKAPGPMGPNAAADAAQEVGLISFEEFFLLLSGSLRCAGFVGIFPSRKGRIICAQSVVLVQAVLAHHPRPLLKRLLS